MSQEGYEPTAETVMRELKIMISDAMHISEKISREDYKRRVSQIVKIKQSIDHRLSVQIEKLIKIIFYRDVNQRISRGTEISWIPSRSSQKNSCSKAVHKNE